jgi:hypothetical protein
MQVKEYQITFCSEERQHFVSTNCHQKIRSVWVWSKTRNMDGISAVQHFFFLSTVQHFFLFLCRPIFVFISLPSNIFFSLPSNIFFYFSAVQHFFYYFSAVRHFFFSAVQHVSLLHSFGDFL